MNHALLLARWGRFTVRRMGSLAGNGLAGLIATVWRPGGRCGMRRRQWRDRCSRRGEGNRPFSQRAIHVPHGRITRREKVWGGHPGALGSLWRRAECWAPAAGACGKGCEIRERAIGGFMGSDPRSPGDGGIEQHPGTDLRTSSPQGRRSSGGRRSPRTCTGMAEYPDASGTRPQPVARVRARMMRRPQRMPTNENCSMSQIRSQPR
jgi:hypothetical protein